MSPHASVKGVGWVASFREQAGVEGGKGSSASRDGRGATNLGKEELIALMARSAARPALPKR